MRIPPFLLLIVFATISSCVYNNADIVAERVGLIAANIDDGGLNGNPTQHLIKYEFSEGELVSAETIVSNPGEQLRFNSKNGRCTKISL